MKKSITRVLSSLLALALLLACAGCGAKKAEEPTAPSGGEQAAKTRIAFVSYMAVDQAEWLQSLAAGLNNYQKNNSNVEIKLVEATQASEYEPKIRALADAKYDVIITTYDNMAAATIAVAQDYPDIKFGSMDGAIANLQNYKNIQEFGLSRTETSYLAGVVAGVMSKTGKVGIVGGADVGPINEIIAGWQQGMRSVNPEMEDVVVYANTFTDPTKGKELGLALLGKGCDIIGGAAGGTGVGAAQAAASKENFYVGWDVHYQEVVGELELGSAVNFFDKMVIQFIEDTMNGKYTPGVRTIYGLAEGACDFEFLEGSKVTEEAKAAVEKAREGITKGEIKISNEPLHK